MFSNFSIPGVFIVSAKRTPFGAYGGLLKDFTATDLTEIAARSALAAGKVSPEIIDSVVVGNVMQVGRTQKMPAGKSSCCTHANVLSLSTFALLPHSRGARNKLEQLQL